MTLQFPDVSDYEAGISLNGMAAVVVKATEGTTYTSPDYARVAADATSRGIPWAAYHFLHHNSDPAAQARHFHQVAGNVPAMLDVETAGDGSRATVGDALAFAAELVRLGGRPRLVYLPHWYWQELGSPDLTPLAGAGMSLVSSDYTTYSDTGPGWASYGGLTPVVWQYTDTHALGGFSVDYNAYRGTADQFRTLLAGGNIAPNVRSMMGTLMCAHERGSNIDWFGDGVRRWASPNPTTTQWGKWAIAQQGGNTTSLEINPGTLAALGPEVVVIDATGNLVPANAETPVLAAIAALQTAVQALAAGGTSVDTAAVISAVNAAAAAESALVADLKGQVAALQARLTAAAKAESDALSS